MPGSPKGVFPVIWKLREAPSLHAITSVAAIVTDPRQQSGKFCFAHPILHPSVHIRTRVAAAEE
jgi:hypothetical protein